MGMQGEHMNNSRGGGSYSHKDIQPTRQPDNPIPLPIRPVPRVLRIAPCTTNQVVALLILMREVDVFLLQGMKQVRIGMFQLDVGFTGLGFRVE